MAVGFIDGRAGLEQFTDERARDPKVRALAAKIGYEIDPADEYPRNFSGHLKAVLADGSVRELHQPHMRGGAREPLSDSDLDEKFGRNPIGGFDERRAQALRAALDEVASEETSTCRPHAHDCVFPLVGPPPARRSLPAASPW